MTTLGRPRGGLFYSGSTSGASNSARHVASSRIASILMRYAFAHSLQSSHASASSPFVLGLAAASGHMPQSRSRLAGIAGHTAGRITGVGWQPLAKRTSNSSSGPRRAVGVFTFRLPVDDPHALGRHVRARDLRLGRSAHALGFGRGLGPELARSPLFVQQVGQNLLLARLHAPRIDLPRAKGEAGSDESHRSKARIREHGRCDHRPVTRSAILLARLPTTSPMELPANPVR